MYRVLIGLCFTMLALGCAEPRHTAITRSLFDIQPARLEMGKEDYFSFYVVNNSDSVLRISDPSLYPNLIISITNEANEEPARLSLIGGSTETINSLVKIGNKNSVMLSYQHKLAELFDVKPRTRYKVRMKYYGLVQIDNKKRMYSKNFVGDLFIK